jgi:hypothetical protein
LALPSSIEAIEEGLHASDEELASQGILFDKQRDPGPSIVNRLKAVAATRGLRLATAAELNAAAR